MLAFLNRVGDEHSTLAAKPSEFRLRIDYNTARNEPNSFQNPSLLDPIDGNQHDEVQQAAERMIEMAQGNGMNETNVATLRSMVTDHMDVFRTSLSAGSVAKVPRLTIDLTEDARPARVQLRNYSREERKFLRTFVSHMLRCKLVYANPSSVWPSAPLIVPMPRPSNFPFTVDPRPVNKFTVRHHFLMPDLKHELTKLAGATVYATFALSHGYWQFPLNELFQECQSLVAPDGT